jgi:hypothetical protein
MGLVILGPTTSHATRIAPGTGDGDNPPSTHLPLNSTDSRTLVRCARDLASVQEVMREFGARGYVAHPEADRGLTADPGKLAVVFLVYEKHGYIAPPNSMGAPVIMVVSTLTWDQGVRTDVAGGFVVLDGTTGRVTVTDASSNGFVAGTSVQDDVYVPEDLRVCCDKQQMEALGQYAVCAGLGNLECVGAGLAASALATPAIGIGLGLGCIAQTTNGCLRETIMHWPR